MEGFSKMDYQALYQSKLTTAENAVKGIKSGDWVDYGWSTCTPVALDKALAARSGNRQGGQRTGAFLLELLAHERH